MKEKIIHILYSGLGGTTDYVFNLIKGDKDRQFEHHILFYGIEKVPGPQLGLAKEISQTVFYIHKQKGYDKKGFKAVLKVVNDLKPTIITLHVNSLILTCSKYKKARLLFIEHQANHLKTKKEWLWSALAQVKSDYVISFTYLYQCGLKNKLRLFYCKNKNILINTGIDLARFSSKKIKNKKLNIGIISRINNFRDHETLLKAFSTIETENCVLKIAGNGPNKKKFEQNFNKKNIIWLGLLNQNEITKLLWELDIYVIASFGESTSIALMQAQASGLPIVATNVKGINNVLTNENCIFVEPKSVQDYKNALEYLINDEVKRDELAKKSLEYAADNLSHLLMFEKYQKLINE